MVKSSSLVAQIDKEINANGDDGTFFKTLIVEISHDKFVLCMSFLLTRATIRLTMTIRIYLFIFLLTSFSPEGGEFTVTLLHCWANTLIAK